MRIEFWGTDQEFENVKNKYGELSKYIKYIDKEISPEEQPANDERNLRELVMDMKQFKSKFVLLMDKFLKSISEE